MVALQLPVAIFNDLIFAFSAHQVVQCTESENDVIQDGSQKR